MQGMMGLSTMVSFLLVVITVFFLMEIARAAELQIETIKTGDCGRKAKKGDRLLMHYEGTLEDGSEFDSSYKRGEPFAFVLGQGMVIKGWDEGLEGICKGEVRNLVIPAHKGYGDRGYPPVIPEKATLKFKVELIEFGPDDEKREL